ncbi:exported hypothetical protein [metagenome]|uniref:Uncharacterized protein n=1 Tax=metagenome TaxID=256318 RepID=A0A2P2BYY6_9ZZZZ
MIPTRHALYAAASTLALAVAVVLPAAPATAAATVDHPECFFEPGDIPGVDEFFPATCTIITTASGITTVVGHAQLPEGYTLSETFVGTLPCFGGIGRVTATVSGRVNATCHLRP